MGVITYRADGNAATFDGPEAVNVYRLAALISGLNLEAKGIRMSRGLSMLAVAKRTTGLKTNKREAQVMALRRMLAEAKAAVGHLHQAGPTVDCDHCGAEKRQGETCNQCGAILPVAGGGQ